MRDTVTLITKILWITLTTEYMIFWTMMTCER
jgi:hypothetical protein